MRDVPKKPLAEAIPLTASHQLYWPIEEVEKKKACPKTDLIRNGTGFTTKYFYLC